MGPLAERIPRGITWKAQPDPQSENVSAKDWRCRHCEDGKQNSCGSWPLAAAKQVYLGKDGVIRAVQLKAAHGVLERPIQHLYPLELSCDRAALTPTCMPTAILNPTWTQALQYSGREPEGMLQLLLELEFRTLRNTNHELWTLS